MNSKSPLSAISVTLAASNFEQTSATDSSGVVQFNGPAGEATATVRNDKKLADALAALVEKTPRDTPASGQSWICSDNTFQKANLGIPVAAGIPEEIMIIARTDVVFAIPEGWEDLQPSVPGPWRLSKSDPRAILQLVSQGLGRSVTLQCPAVEKVPFAGAFQPSPLWSPDHKRILQPGESLTSLAEKYLGDASEVDTLVALNPHVSAIHSGVTGSPPSPVTLPPEAVPGWLSIPQTVHSVTAEIEPVVVLFPVVHDADYGTSTSAQLAEMTRIAVACLHSMGILVRDNSKKAPFRGLKRLGIAGFSFGGTALWQALHSAVDEHGRTGGSKNQIQEIYAFDANRWRTMKANPVDILTTAKQTGEARLRVVVATKADADLTAFSASKNLTSSAHPDFKKADIFDIVKANSRGGNPDINGWYLHYTDAQFKKKGKDEWLKKQKGKGIPDEGNLDRGARHQFAVFGGEDPSVGETFFSRFLKDSGF